MLKRTISLFLTLMTAVFCLSCFTVPANAAVDARNGVAVVCCLFEDADRGVPVGMVSRGSCFFVGKDGQDPEHLITNYHVIDYYLELGSGRLGNAPASVLYDDESQSGHCTGRAKLRVYFDANDYVEAYPVEYDSKKDIAILKIDQPTAKRSPLHLRVPVDADVGNHTSVRAIGFPGIADNDLAGSVSEWGMTDVSVNGGSISRMLTQSGTGVRTLQIDCEINHGNSGGPLVDEDGNVLGINTWSAVISDDEETISVNYAINISESLPMLDRNNVPYVLATGSVNIWLIVIIAAAALIVAGVIVLLVVLLSRKRKNKDKKKDGGATVATDAPAAKQPYVRSLSTQHGGLRVPIASGEVVIGRDPQGCAICYSNTTPGVSGRHCSLTYDSATGEFILKDYKSTYGTFLQNGEKLAPLQAYRLRAGDRFYVGEIGNMLVVELG